MPSVREREPEAGAGAPAIRPLSAFAGSLGQRVHATLREAILTLALAPGQTLRKAEICAALGVSRSPVSEAIAKLAGEGLVVVAPQAGTYVARFSLTDIREGAFLREALEVAAIRRVAAAATEAQITELRRVLRLQELLVADGDLPGFFSEDAAMHELILSYTGFRRLVPLTRSAWVNVDRARRMMLPAPGRAEATIKEHRAILAALEARDPEAAEAATRAHLGQLLAQLERLAETDPGLFAPE